MSDDTGDTSNDQGPEPRSVRGDHRQPSAPLPDDEGDPRAELEAVDGERVNDQDGGDPDIEAELEDAVDQFGSLAGVTASFKGPLPPASILRGYEELVPGSAADLINAHVRRVNSSSNALTRLTRAESFGVVTGTIVSGLRTLGGLTAGVILIVNGYPTESLFGFIPAAGTAVAIVISAVRGNKAE